MIEQIYQSVVQKHDYQLLLIALVLCLFSSFTAVSLQQRARNSREQKRDQWIVLSAIAIGLGIWSTHVISIMAYDISVPISYGFISLTLALLVALVSAAFSFRIVTYNRAKRGRAAGGFFMGVGICCAHYALLYTLNFQGKVSHSVDFTILSILAGLVLAIAALVGMNKTQDIVRYCVSASLLAAAICSVHFTAMTGLVVEYDQSVKFAEGMISEAHLVVGISLVTLLFLGFCLSKAFVGDGSGDGSLETAHLRSLADAALEGIVVMDAGGHIVNANQSFLSLCGKKLSELKGHHIKRYFRHFSGEDNISSLAEDAAHLDGVGLLRPGQDEIPTELFFRQAVVNGETQHVAVVRDLREKLEAENKISYLSNFDQLTGLANRQLMMEKLYQAVPSALRQKNNVAVLYLDIDGFKELNSIVGQQGGDKLLSILATRLKTYVGEHDTVARIGADQFCIIQEHLGKVEAVGLFAEKLCEMMDEKFLLGRRKVAVSLSIGIAVAPIDTESPSDLYAYAEVAMKNAKTSVGNSYHFYEEALDRAQIQRRQLKNDLMGSLQRGEISMVYQPQFGALENDIVGFEALVRWHHPKRGPIGPGEFIPLAEENGFILELGTWVLEEACREAASWTNDINIAVNLSPVQFQQGGLPEIVANALKRNGLAPERLEIEITEGVLIDDVDHALGVLTQLKDSGVKLAMDDFGTGYSSLSYLQSFPFDKLKIDQSFIQTLQENEQSLGIVRGMIGLAHGLNVPIIAEGVETEEQFAMLRVEGCDEIQGYFLGKPKPISEYADLVHPNSQATAVSPDNSLGQVEA